MNMKDPKEIIAQSPMGVFQIAAVVLCVGLNALDGFDVLSISFASPGIADEWGIDRGALGIVLSMELIGMGVGAVVLGNIADTFGRRPTIMGCIVIMTIGMFLASIAGGVQSLSVYRFVTGLGIGGLLASINAMVAEYSNAKRRNLAVIIMASGYPIGAVIGGSIASLLLASFDWRSVFVFGALASAAFIPLIWFLLPESIEFLAKKRPRGALDQINLTLKRMGHQTINALPEPEQEEPKVGVARLFTPDLARITVLLTVAYFAHLMTFYFFMKWTPKIVVDMGYEASLAGSVLVWANVGGVIGCILLSILAQRFEVRSLVTGSCIMSAVAVAVFGSGLADLVQLSLIAAAAGFFANVTCVGLFAIFVQSFPTEIRAGGTGFVIGIGRPGAVLGPIVAGFLFEAGQDLQIVALIVAMGSALAAIALFVLPAARPHPVRAQE